MKRGELERHLRGNGCQPDREGGRHSIWTNPANGNRTAVPRHGEIASGTMREICRDLGITPPKGR